jgi:hypothetical protein
MFRSKMLSSNTFRIVFIIVLAALVIGFFFQMNLSKGTEGSQVFFQNPNDYFQDFFSVQKNIASMSPISEAGQIYPPLAYSFFYPFNSFLPYDQMDRWAARATQNGIMSYIIFLVIWLFIGIVFLMRLLSEEKRWQKNLILLLLFLSAPVLFLLERGNINVAVLAFIAVYFAYYESESKGLREVAIVALAIATGIKIYPALFGLLLLKKGTFLSFLRLTAYCIVLLVLPMFFYKEGLSNVAAMFINIKNLNEYLTKTSDSFALMGTLGYQSIFRYLAILRGANFQTWYLTAANITSYAMLIFSIAGSFLVKYKWQKAALLTCPIVLFPTISGVYNLVFLIIPVILFLIEKEKRWFDYLYLLLFLVILNPVQYGSWMPMVSRSTIIANVTAAVINGLLCIEGLVQLIKIIKKQAVIKKSGERPLFDET